MIPLTHDSDSEDDDYVPPAETNSPESSDSEGGPEPKRPRTSPPREPELDEVEKKKARDALWSSFQASVSSTASIQPAPVEEMVKVEKRYKFAGETIMCASPVLFFGLPLIQSAREVVEVPVYSPDAKKWPLWREKTDSAVETDLSTPTPRETSTSKDVSSKPSTSTKPPAKRPGPRRSKITLGAIPTQKAKKLSTLDKSAMDWQAHLQGADGSSFKDELEANRRGGGYLEKVEFLNRVEGRKEEVIEASTSTKRRRN
ncbi:hypothetical protein H0H87_012057 [Tephrocybe sp. NHM501043]|nr:hypothetical protein H0H87_012057 [Tephrocybe sp. NHM501043]